MKLMEKNWILKKNSEIQYTIDALGYSDIVIDDF